jgi:hypothetical protein
MWSIYRDWDDTTVLYLRYHTMLLEAQECWVWFRCFDTQRRVSRIGPIMTIQFLMSFCMSCAAGFLRDKMGSGVSMNKTDSKLW